MPYDEEPRASSKRADPRCVTLDRPRKFLKKRGTAKLIAIAASKPSGRRLLHYHRR